MFDLIKQDDGHSRSITLRQSAISLDVHFPRCNVQFRLKMYGDTVDDIAEMAPFARQDGHMDWHAHGVTTQGQQMTDAQEDTMREARLSGRAWRGLQYY